ncbi:MAG: TolC family protein, partial [Bacteroidales bacterium]|nr:TolC family protein [Bacteroidales bacterium]
MKIKIILTLFAFVYISQIAKSQNVWDLEKCILYALENNLQIKQQELSAKTSEINYTQKRASILPNLNAGANQNFTFGRSVDPFTNEFSSESTQSNNFSISSSVTLFSGLQNVNSIKQSKLNLLAAYENVKKIKNDISLNIASSYLNILFNIELHSIAINQALITNEQLERTKKLVKAGSLPKGNLLDIQAQIASEELQIVNAKNQLDISYLTLKQFLDIDSIEDFQIDIPSNLSIIDSEEDAQTIYNNALNTLPQIKGAEYMLMSYEKGLSIARGMISPRLALSANYGTGYSDARMIPYGDPTISSFISGYTEDLQNVYTYQPIYNYAV